MTEQYDFIAKDFNGVSPEALKVAIKKAAQKNHKAFRVIFNAFYEKLISHFIFDKEVDVDVAKDLAIEVLSKVWEKASMYDSSRGEVTTWVYNVADFHFIDYIRREQSKKNYFYLYKLINTDYAEAPSEFNVHGRTKNPEQIMIKSEASDFINDLFCEDVLGAGLMKIMELRYVKELSLKEVAKKLKMNDSTVRVQLRRGRIKIQEFISSNFELASQFALPQMAM